MTDAPQPISGSLEAKIIRKCPVHATCLLTCPRRPVEDLGEIAHVHAPPPSEPGRGVREHLTAWLEHITHRGAPP